MKKTTLAVMGLAATMLAGQAFAADAVAPKDGMGMHHGRHHGFQDADTNKDGNISKAEFHAQGDKMFAKLDTNGDGVISKEEREAKRKEWQAKRADWKAHKGEAGKTAPAKAE